jgi:hypothetical protein
MEAIRLDPLRAVAIQLIHSNRTRYLPVGVSLWGINHPMLRRSSPHLCRQGTKVPPPLRVLQGIREAPRRTAEVDGSAGATLADLTGAHLAGR